MKKILGFAFASLMLATASASELWWTLAMDEKGKVSVENEKTGESSDCTWQTAKLYANTTGYNYGSKTAIATIALGQLQDISMASTDVSSYSGYSFYVELYNSTTVFNDSTFVGRSSVSSSKGAISYSDLSGNIFTDAFNTPGTTAYEFDNFTTAEVIPEPTSGLMVLLGAVLLGLKRKKEIV